MGEILLVDDADFARRLLRRILEEEGYRICGEAGNGREGLEKFKSLKPDLVFCDIYMNEMDGQSCLKAILREDPTASVVVCSSMSTKPIVEEVFQNGAKGFLEKPVNAWKLLQITEKLIGKPKEKVSYGALMEKRALEAGIGEKQILDFFEAFRSISGFSMDDARVDDQYLKKSGEGLLIAVRALLSAKMSMGQMSRLEDIFQGLTS